MAYQVLARKYRPTRFSDVVGQDHVTRTLLNALAQDRIAHGYIFSGHRGIGKTTIARILASALNCRNAIGSPARPTPEPCNACESCLEIRQGNAVDVLEIDAATNRGIDEIRELRDAARYQPARDRFKIIILDEAHQITDAAFNALLKTLEEPPEHIVFMMATTQPEDIPQTIRSRCQHFSFHAVKLDEIVGQLAKISDDENIIVDEATLGLLAEAGDGSMRDALSIMDQAIASAPVEDGRPVLELEAIRELMGAVSNVVFEAMLAAAYNNDAAEMLALLNRSLEAGNGPQAICRQLVRFLRNCTVAKITGLQPDATATGYAADLLQISTEERRRAARAAALFTEEELARFLAITLRTFDDLGYKQEPRFHLELGLLKLVQIQRLVPLEQVLSQLGATPPARLPQPKPPAQRVTVQAEAEAAVPRIVRPQPAPQPATRAAAPTPLVILSEAKDPRISPAAPPKPQEAPAPPPEPPKSEPTPVRPSPPPPAEARPAELAPAFFNSPANEAPAPTTAAAPAITSKNTPPAPAAPQEDDGYLAALSAAADNEAEPPAEIAEAKPPAEPTEALQSSVLAALEDAKHGDAAHQLEEATWTLTGSDLAIQTTLSEKMLGFVLTPASQQILRNVIREKAGPQVAVRLLPGTPASAAAKTKKPRAARAGSAAELAEKHPLVQEARRLFSAEIANVIDLRGQD